MGAGSPSPDDRQVPQILTKSTRYNFSLLNEILCRVFEQKQRLVLEQEQCLAFEEEQRGLSEKEQCLVVEQEDTSSYSTGRHPVEQENPQQPKTTPQEQNF